MSNPASTRPEETTPNPLVPLTEADFHAALHQEIHQNYHSDASTSIRVPGSSEIQLPVVPTFDNVTDDDSSNMEDISPIPTQGSKALPMSTSMASLISNTSLPDFETVKKKKKKPELRDLLKPMMPAPPRYQPMQSHRLPPLNSPDAHLLSIEFPGYVKESTESVEKFIEMCGGMSAIVKTYERSMGGKQSSIDLRYRPDNPYHHPIPGEVLNSANLLLRIVRRRKKGQEEWQENAEIVGVIGKTCRFRTLGDFQYVPDRTWQMTKLRDALDALDGM